MRKRRVQQRTRQWRVQLGEGARSGIPPLESCRTGKEKRGMGPGNLPLARAAGSSRGKKCERSEHRWGFPRHPLPHVTASLTGSRVPHPASRPPQLPNCLFPRPPFPRPSSLVPRPSSLVPRPPSLFPRPSSLVPRPSSLVPLPSSLVPRPPSLVPRPSSLVPRPSSLVPRPPSLVPRLSPLVPSPRPSALFAHPLTAPCGEAA